MRSGKYQRPATGKRWFAQLVWLTAVQLANSGCGQSFESKAQPSPLPNSAEQGAITFDALTIPREQVRAGGPPKDGIPAISEPQIVAADQASFLSSQSRVIATKLNGEARAWPVAILNYHEIVNDQLGGVPIVITYCPLCDSAAVFDRRTPLGLREFGVSGMLYNSNVLMYDRAAGQQSLWSQLSGKGVSGPAANQSLKLLPVELTTWNSWRARHPRTTVMSPRTGYRRDYTRNPYAGYFDTDRLMFPVARSSHRLPPKQRVLGLRHAAGSIAVPTTLIDRLPREGDRIYRLEFDGKQVQVAIAPSSRSLRVIQVDKGVEWMYSLWFAWHAFHP